MCQSFFCINMGLKGLSRKKVWIIRFALSLGYSLLMYWINSHFNFFEIAFARLHVTFRRWRVITIAKKIHWRTLCIIVRTMVIFLNRHHQNHSEQPVKQRKQDKICLSGAYTRCCYCVRSELFCPRCLNEQLFAANNSRPRDVACDSRAKGCYGWFCRCRAFLVLFPLKITK